MRGLGLGLASPCPPAFGIRHTRPVFGAVLSAAARRWGLAVPGQGGVRGLGGRRCEGEVRCGLAPEAPSPVAMPWHPDEPATCTVSGRRGTS